MKNKNLTIFENRIFVANLINRVLSGEISVQDALERFPKDKNDINIKCAFDALLHREADEDLRKEEDYATVQDEFLQSIANILKENEKLPKNIIDEYKKFHNEDLIGENLSFIKSVFKNFKKMINF